MMHHVLGLGDSRSLVGGTEGDLDWQFAFPESKTDRREIKVSQCL